MGMNRGLIRALSLAFLAGGTAVAFTYRNELDAAALATWWRERGCCPAVVHHAVCLGYGAVPARIGIDAGRWRLVRALVGTLYSLTGATLGAVSAFLIARHLAAGWVQTRVESGTGGRFARLVSGVEAEGWRFVAFTRLVPLFPFNLLNYALGLTRIPLPHYLIASFVFMSPGTFAYAYLGYAGREAVAGGEGLIRNA